MPYEYHSASELFGHIGEIGHYGAYLVGAVHINITQIGLKGIQYDEPCIGQPECFVKSAVGDGKRVFGLINTVYVAAVRTRSDEPRLYCVGKPVLGSLKYHSVGIQLIARKGILSLSRNCTAVGQCSCDVQCESSLALSGITLYYCDLSVGDIGVPEPFGLGRLDLCHVVKSFDHCFLPP